MIHLRSAALTLLGGAALLFSPDLVQAASDAEVAARNVATSIAGAFANDGFKLRDGCWQGSLQPHQSRLIQVNLYAGNQYWFSLGATPEAKKITVTVHDEAGKPMPIEPFTEDSKAAAGFAPKISGPYYLRIEEAEGTPAGFCLVYSYK